MSVNLTQNKIKGFTLLELLVSLSIIGIILALAVASLTGSQAQARDTKRKSDLSSYRTAFENMANRNNNFYRGGLNNVALNSSSMCAALQMGSTCPDDPLPGNDYFVFTNGTVDTYNATQYLMYAILEDSSPNSYWVVCSNGKVGAVTSQPTNSTCPSSI